MSRSKRRKKKDRKKRKIRSIRRLAGAAARPARCKALIALDTAAIRKQAARFCRLALSTFKKAEKEWELFVKREQPAYMRWITNALGPLLSEIRELHYELAHKESLLQAVAFDSMMTGDAPGQCYERILHEEKRSEQAHAEDTDEDNDREGEEDPFEEDDDFDDPYESEDRHFARDFAKALGIDLDSFGLEMENDFPAHRRRIKNIYRKICRRLHPDAAGSMNERTQDLWNWTQAAYENNDLKRLEIILALSQMDQGRFPDETTVADILAATHHFRRARDAIRKEIRSFRKGAEWGFLSWPEERKRRRLKTQRAYTERKRDYLRTHLSMVEYELGCLRGRAETREAGRPREQGRQTIIPPAPEDAPQTRFTFF